QGEDRGENHRHRRDIDGVPEGADEEVGPREVDEIDEGEGARALLREGDVDHRPHRNDEEEGEEDGDREGEGELPRRRGRHEMPERSGRRMRTPGGRGVSHGRSPEWTWKRGGGPAGEPPGRDAGSARALERLFGLRLGLRIALLGEGGPLLLELGLTGALLLAAGEGAGDLG